MAISEQEFERVAKELNIPVAAIKAVAEVESSGSGFLKDGQPTILFERHIFHRLTKGKYSSLYPEISNPVAGGYGAAGQNQHNKLQKAVSLDKEAGLSSASYGVFQMMGFNWRMMGYKSLQEFINAAYKDENAHLDMFVRYIKANNLQTFIQKKDWAGFARRYNGPAYAKNAYDTKMAAAYKKYGGK